MTEKRKMDTNALRKAGEGGAIITWEDKDEDSPPMKPTKQKTLGDYTTVVLLIGGGIVAALTIIAIKSASAKNMQAAPVQIDGLCPTHTYPSGKVAVSREVNGECQWPNWVQCVQDEDCPTSNKCNDGACIPPARAVDPWQSPAPPPYNPGMGVQ